MGRAYMGYAVVKRGNAINHTVQHSAMEEEPVV
jgi:hypothetical protein